MIFALGDSTHAALIFDRLDSEQESAMRLVFPQE